MSYRRLAGGLLLWGTLPYPFNQIAAIPFWALGFAAGFTALRMSAPFRPSRRAQNVLGIVMVLAVLVAGGWSIGPLRPLGHLLLQLAALRVLMVEERAHYLKSLGPIGLAWVAGVAASTHVTLVLYLIGSAVLIWWVGMRTFLMAAAEDVGARPPRRVIRPAHVARSTVAVVLLAVPVFLLMPRLRSPWLAGGRGRGSVAGFTSAVELSGVGRIKASRQVALVVTAVRGGMLPPPLLRLRATAFDLLETGVWKPRRSDLRSLGSGGQITWLVENQPELVRMIELEIELLRPEEYLFLPRGTVAVRCPYSLSMDGAGGLLLSRRVRRPVTYTAWVDPAFRRRFAEPGRRDLLVPRSREVLGDLARSMVGEQTGEAARARTIERTLQRRYRYSLRGPSRFSSDPIAEFLLATREGHCELFAGSMVLLERSLGTPARMVAGYAGGTLGPSGTVLHVRQSNAHTWVEVWLGEERGWVTFDPTPPSGVPTLAPASAMARLRWIADKVQVTWDRYVLTFGAQDQLDLITGAVAGTLRLAQTIRPVQIVVAAAGLAGLVFVVWVLAGARGRRHWIRRETAAYAVDRVRARLERRGSEVPPSATPRRIACMAASKWPVMEGPVTALAELAESELYSGQELEPGQRRRARDLSRTIRRSWGRVGAPGAAHRGSAPDQ